MEGVGVAGELFEAGNGLGMNLFGTPGEDRRICLRADPGRYG